ncbi:MAG: hypothetical protein ACOCQ3_03875 [Natronomonas sp.]
MIAGLVALSGTVSAHGGVGDGGTPAAFVVVLGLPIIAGLLGGVMALRRNQLTRLVGQYPSGIVLGLLLVVLGATFAITAGTERLSITIIAGTVGIISAVGISRRGPSTSPGCSGHAHLTVGAVFAHRVLEGIVLGALYSTGSVVGLVGATILAGHAALETAAVGGLYASHRLRASSSIVLVQVGYASGIAAGVFITGTIPTPVRIVAIALAGGILLGTGGVELNRSFAVYHDQRRRIDREAQAGIEVE